MRAGLFLFFMTVPKENPRRRMMSGVCLQSGPVFRLLEDYDKRNFSDIQNYLAAKEKTKSRKNTALARMSIQIDEMTKYRKNDMMK